MGSTRFRDPQALSSALAAFETLQPRAFGSLNRVDPLDSVSNYYLEVTEEPMIHTWPDTPDLCQESQAPQHSVGKGLPPVAVQFKWFPQQQIHMYVQLGKRST